ncbi:hypothetical protein [Fontibacter flavus]|uniref:PepSY domain-containing protein n=1 Tax=Fontibacter flavus TaxID=654838 RepID=A0ABV6FY11_9BACT
MKKQLFIPAILAFGISVSPLMASSMISFYESTEMIIDQEKVKLDPNHLPDPVKNAIQNDATIKELTITEAWQIIEEDGTTHFKVKFDKAGEIIAKKYDPEGKEIND